eukprot:Nitzschia sp. Nitz4//scaffold4_size323378//67028//67977//NITZ4_000630-RA/size323378-snap-gene-0.443-mRNA-1//-1//CDS//3329553309//3350//frame0
MCFSDSKKGEIMTRLGIAKDNDDLLKVLAEEWRSLSDKEKADWDEEARNDKVRFVREKAAYKGPHMIPKRRAKKHPLAPKRPMSAFLKFSKIQRPLVKRDNPDMGNTDVSRLLGEMWRNLGPKEKAPYREQELKERNVYKENIKKFRDDQARQDAASRTSHQSVQGGYRQPVREYSPNRNSYPSPVRNTTFEPLRVDSFDDHPSRKSHHSYHHHSASYPSYRHTPNPFEMRYHHRSSEFQEEPLPLTSRPSVAPAYHILEEDDLSGGHALGVPYSARSFAYPESMSSGPHYSRYP